MEKVGARGEEERRAVCEVGEVHCETECEANREATSRDGKISETKGHSAQHSGKFKRVNGL